jgi:hypothetical protein
MRKHILLKQFVAVLIMLTAIVYFGCEQKTEKADEPQDEVKTEGVPSDTSSGVKEPAAEEITIPNLTGTWSGVFDGRSTVLNITEQTDSSFSGKISISYRQQINQEVKGSFSPTTMIISMADQLHSRYRGKYNGKLSDDADNFSGTFTMDLDGKKYSFNLNKK